MLYQVKLKPWQELVQMCDYLDKDGIYIGNLCLDRQDYINLSNMDLKVELDENNYKSRYYLDNREEFNNFHIYSIHKNLNGSEYMIRRCYYIWSLKENGIFNYKEIR